MRVVHRHSLMLYGVAAALMLTSPLLAPASPDYTESPKDSAKWRLATLAAARDILDQVEHPAPISDADRILLTERLNETMRKNVAAHASRTESQRLCAEQAARFQREALEKRFLAITAHAGEQSPLPVTWTDVTGHLGERWTEKLNKSLADFTTAQLSPVFKDARARAVGLLRQEVEQAVRYPTDKEADTLLSELVAKHPETARLSSDDEKKLQQGLLTLIHPEDKPLFEELKSPLEDQSRQLTAELIRQYDRQLAIRDEALSRDIPENQREAPVMANTMITLLDATLSREQAKPAVTDRNGRPIPVYGLFTTVRNSLPDRATGLETSRFQKFLTQTPLLVLQPGTLATSIEAAPEKHRLLTDSTAVFMNLLSSTLLDPVVTAYASGAVPAGQDAYFKSLLTTNPALANVYHDRLVSELNRHLPTARKTVSEAQYLRYFSDLEPEGTLSPAALLILQESGGATFTSLPDALKLFSRSTRAENSLLEETTHRVLDLANRKGREGHEVLTAQFALLRRVEAERLEQLRKDVAARRSLKDIRGEWDAIMETGWKADPRSRSTPYDKIQEPVSTLLDKTTRQLYDTLQDNPQAALAIAPVVAQAGTDTDKGKLKEARQEPAKAEDRNAEPKKDDAPPKKDETVPTDPNSAPKDNAQDLAVNSVLSKLKADRKNAPDGVLILTGVSSGTAVARLITIAENESYDIPFYPARPEEAASVLFEGLKPHLEILWKDTANAWQKAHSGLGFLKRKTPPKLKLLIVIQSDDIRHRMSLLLRDHLEKAFEQWHTSLGKDVPAVDLDWKVGLTFDLLQTGQ